jgi:hypothetical protein
MDHEDGQVSAEDAAKPRYAYADKVPEEEIEELSDQFMILHYVVRPYSPMEKQIARTTAGRFKEGMEVRLNVNHFAAMWIIELLSKRHAECLGLEVRNLLHWKHDFTKEDFSGIILDPLRALLLIDTDTVSKQNRSTPNIKITADGYKFLNKMKRRRREAMRKLLRLAGVNKDTFESFRQRLNEISENAWMELKEEAAVRSRLKTL